VNPNSKSIDDIIKASNIKNTPGVFKPSSHVRYAGLENRKYTPINTQSFADLFSMGLDKKALQTLMKDNEQTSGSVSDDDLEFYLNKILSRVNKGDTAGGMVGYHFPDNEFRFTENGKDYRESGTYTSAIDGAISSYLKNRPTFKGEKIKTENGNKTLHIPPTKEANNWISGLTKLREMKAAYPDTFSLFGKQDEHTLKTLLHEPLHSIFTHDEGDGELDYSSYHKERGVKAGQRGGFSQERYSKTTDIMEQNILKQISKKQLQEMISNILNPK
jgi:hypothetical protein